MPHDTQFQTERLQIQHWTSQLATTPQRAVLRAEVSNILSPAVLKYLPEPLQLGGGHEAIERWISARHAESKVMLIRDKETSGLLGLLILAEFTEDDAPETIHLGYLLAEPAWGKGYATELLTGLVDFYSRLDRRVRLIGGVEKDNVASARVLQKVGFKRNTDISSGSTDMYQLDIED